MAEYQYGIRWTDETVTACRDFVEAQKLSEDTLELGPVMVAREVVSEWQEVDW